MTEDVIAFIRAQLGDDANRARLVLSGYAGHQAEWQAISTGVVLLGRELLPTGDGPIGEHVARHDPARVLGQCAALSDTLTELEQIAERSSDPDTRMHAQAAIQRMSLIWQAADESDEQHPDYREEWKP